MIKIGLISDTHSYLDPELFKVFSQVDEIWHAGDIGDPGLIGELESFKKFRGVYGNIDNQKVRLVLPLDLTFEVEGLKVFMTHIAGYPGRYNRRVKPLFKAEQPGLVICGHSHILKVIYDKTFKHLHMNPGACGHHGFHTIRTAIRFEIEAGQIKKPEVIELGRRGILSTPD